MKDYPQVDVLIPVYNVARFIEKCLISVLEQNYPNLHIVLVNDASPDDSMAIARRVAEEKNRYKHSIELIDCKQNRGIGSVRQLLLSKATGKYVLFIDSDDYWDNPLVVKEWVDVAEAGNYSVVVSDYCHEYPMREDSVIERIKNFSSGKEFACQILSSVQEGYFWNKLFLREDLQKYTHLDMKGINFWEDMLLVVPVLYYANSVGYYPKVTVHYLHHSSSQYTATIKPNYIGMLGIIFEQLDNQFYTDLQKDKQLWESLNHAKYRAFYIVALLPYKYYKQVRQMELHISPNSYPFGRGKQLKKFTYRLFKSPLTMPLAIFPMKVYELIGKLKVEKSPYRV